MSLKYTLLIILIVYLSSCTGDIIERKKRRNKHIDVHNHAHNRKHNHANKNENNDVSSSHVVVFKEGSPPSQEYIISKLEDAAHFTATMHRRYVPPQLRGNTTNTATTTTTTTTSSFVPITTKSQNIARRRLARDLKEWQIEQAHISSIAAHPMDNNLFEWHVNIKPTNGVYSGVYFHLIMTFPDTYPSEPPQIKICTPIRHKDYDLDKVCSRLQYGEIEGQCETDCDVLCPQGFYEVTKEECVGQQHIANDIATFNGCGNGYW